MGSIHNPGNLHATEWTAGSKERTRCRVFNSAPILYVLADLLDYSRNPATETMTDLCVGTLLTSLIVCGFVSVRKPVSGYQAQIIALSEIGDVTSLNRLIGALDSGEPPARRRAETAVSSLLRSVTLESECTITAESREILYRHLAGDNVRLIVSILGLLTYLRDEQALPMLERLTASEKPTALDPDVRAAALAILPVLREIKAHKSGKRTLLRASSVETTIADTALRPVMHNNTDDPEVLLRAPHSNS